MRSPIRVFLVTAGVLGLSFLTAFSILEKNQPPRSKGYVAPPPDRPLTNKLFISAHGDPDQFGYDYLDRLATRVWHLPLEKWQVGWRHDDVIWMTYRKARVTVFFVLTAKADDPYKFDFQFFTYADSRTSNLLLKSAGDARMLKAYPSRYDGPARFAGSVP